MHSTLLLCLICLFLPAFTQASLTEQGVSEGVWENAPSLMYKNNSLRCYMKGVQRMVEPYVALRVPKGGLEVRVNPLGQGYYVSVPLVVDYSVELPGGTATKWHWLKVQDFRVSLRKSIRESCTQSCPQVSVSGRWRDGRFPSITFRCRDRSSCLSLSLALHFTGPDQEALLSALHFTFNCWGNHVGFRLERVGLPVVNTVTRPFSDEFWFEGDKLMLYTVKANSGHMVYETYQKEQTYEAPRDGSLPTIYRSRLVDQLSEVAKVGRWQIVAEMRKWGKVVTQVVFSADPDGLDKNSWFSPKRILSTQPYWFGRSNFNIFSIAGDVRSGVRRRFTINQHYGGCDVDKSMFFIAEATDSCPFVNKHWQGKAPALIYNPNNDQPDSSASDYAENFLIYMRAEIPVPPPFAAMQTALSGAYQFENDKILLFTVKANSGHKAVPTFMQHQPHYNNASSGPLPDLYRSDLIDSLSQAVIDSGNQYMVAEMRVDNRMVSQVVFDTSIDRESLNKTNWFHQMRVVSSYPYRAVRDLTNADPIFQNPKANDVRFRHFSIPGDHDGAVKRGFLIAFLYGGCPGDSIFWAVADALDVCTYVNSGWLGRAPVFVYTEKDGVPVQSQAKYADRFLIYLM